MSSPPRREVHCDDALGWLARTGTLTGCALITSMPDVSELGGASLEVWRTFFSAAAGLVLAATPADSVTIFFQTDIKKEGVWVDKGYLCQRAAEQARAHELFHKIVCRVKPGAITFGRPAYSHLLGFSRGLALNAAKATADVLPEAGETTWTRGMGVAACEAACRFVLENTDARTVVDPFCGHGTLLAVANALGLDAIGVEKSAKRARKARSLRLEPGGRLSLASDQG